MNSLSQVFGPLLPRPFHPIGNLINPGPIGEFSMPSRPGPLRPGRPAIQDSIVSELHQTPSAALENIVSQINSNPSGNIKDLPVAPVTPESPYRILIPVAIASALVAGAVLIARL